MADVVDAQTRSRMMSGIRGKDTKPELVIRSGLHRRGLRYRLHDKRLPGKPDMVFRRRKAVIFVHGCFWHGHDCPLFKWPSTHPEFWREKIEGNRARDSKAESRLSELSWRQARIWECALKGKQCHEPEAVIDELAGWLDSDSDSLTIRGQHEPFPDRPDGLAG